ncbi:MAG: hypothetical protein LBP33_00880 [Candidatus Adiutrix sp.]|jgi:hypothetical protein|nr:hypothetical protein [Candidatus Adiutrix sp.]
MDSLKNILKEKKSGPGLYFNGEDELVTLGALEYLHSEISNAIEAAVDWAEEAYKTNKNSAVAYSGEFLKCKLLVEYAFDRLNVLFPCKDLEGKEI